MIDLIASWQTCRMQLESVVAKGKRHPLSSVRLLAPVQRPGKIFAIGLNYADHIAESKMETPKHQVWFTKAVTSINGPYSPIQIPNGSFFVDYEVELVAVIGKRGRHISKDKAREHVFGYCVGNDVTERFWQHRTPQSAPGSRRRTKSPIRMRWDCAVSSMARNARTRAPNTWFLISGIRSSTCPTP
jgi:2-keto-4-pentenoate hydratase/2-oxohepta-3-ene-1,7-dioic acid hydratase in catechol pathway